MAMHFYWGWEVTFLVEGWRAETPGAFLGLVVLTVGWGIAHEYVGEVRRRRQREGAGRLSVGEAGGWLYMEDGEDEEEEEELGEEVRGGGGEGNSLREGLLGVGSSGREGEDGGVDAPRGRRGGSAAAAGRTGTDRAHLVATALHATHLASSYLLMLIVMTFNAGLFLAVVGGLCLGFYLFGRHRPVAAGADVC